MRENRDFLQTPSNRRWGGTVEEGQKFLVMFDN